ncbi:MAG: sugar phosphate isomerase/epimerase [Chloroflexi bacterium]|nr:sugar phosphate isomerase/epimerase [Chloroflexota bacterium]
MHIGFLTNCLRERRLPEIIAWAGANGFAWLEVACWPPHTDKMDPSLDVSHFTQADADALNAFAKQHGVAFSCLTYCENPLDRDAAKRDAMVRHLYRVVDAAQRLGVNTISTFVGRDETKTQAQNFDEMTRVFTPLLEYAAERNIRVAIENCPMPGWQFEGLPGNLAYAPVLWDEMFTRLPYANFGLNLDPSHLVWLGVNYYDIVPKYASRIFHTHAKDTQIYPDKRATYSILNSGWDTWWKYRLPGKGEIDWRRWAAVLRANGYDGVLSIEHEDPDYEHTEELVKEGLLIGKKNLREAIA